MNQIQSEIVGYIAIPRREKPGWLYPDYPDVFPPQAEDHFFRGDRDNHSTIEVESIEDLEALAYKYDGHQWVNVRTLAKEMIEELT